MMIFVKRDQSQWSPNEPMFIPLLNMSNKISPAFVEVYSGLLAAGQIRSIVKY